MEKTCTTCKQVKPLSEFNRNKCKVDGYQTLCKDCSKKRSRRYYSDNKEKHRNVVNARKNLQRRQVANKLMEIKSCGCVFCSEDDPICMDFHHLDPKTKNFEVGYAASLGLKWESVEAEIRKCVVVCANCHRKVHKGKLHPTESMLCKLNGS